MNVKPRDAYFAARYVDAEGKISFSYEEADIADPEADIVIWALFNIQSNVLNKNVKLDQAKSPVEGYYDPKIDSFKTVGWSRKGEPLYKAAIQTIKHFSDKLCSGPIQVLPSLFTKMTLPLIRKVYPKLIAEKLVSVQPMSQPASLEYYIKHKVKT